MYFSLLPTSHKDDKCNWRNPRPESTCTQRNFDSYLPFESAFQLSQITVLVVNLTLAIWLSVKIFPIRKSENDDSDGPSPPPWMLGALFIGLIVAMISGTACYIRFYYAKGFTEESIIEGLNYSCPDGHDSWIWQLATRRCETHAIPVSQPPNLYDLSDARWSLTSPWPSGWSPLGSKG